MFEKIRISEHMEVTNNEGGHVGTVDAVEGERIKLTRSDASDNRHHFIDLDSVDRIEDNRVYLKPGTSVTHDDGSRHEMANTGADTQTGTASPTSGGAAGEAGSARPGSAPSSAPIFGTSGHGTGMGGSGTGNA